LRRSLLIVELVPERLFNRLGVSFERITTFHFGDLGVHGCEELLLVLCLLLLEELLILMIVRLLLEDVAVDVYVEHKVVDVLVLLEATVLERELAQIVRCLRVV